MKRAAATNADLAALTGARGIVLAVSGGPDSTALMLLVAGWTEKPPVLVVTVDHGLRPESAPESLQVQRNAEALSLPWRGVRCAEIAPGGNLQARAREARYAALTAAAREAEFDTIATAHHQDDQAETFLLRLARGSGVYGLGAIPAERFAPGVRIVRPLLGWTRAELDAVVARSGLPVAHDPSNRDRRFDRVRIREVMPVLAQQGLTAARLAGTAERLGRVAEALDWAADDILRKHFSSDRLGIVRGRVQALGDTHREIGLRVLSRIIAAASGAEYPPPTEGLEALFASVAAAEHGKTMRRTLHGAVVTATNGTLVAEREWGRAGVPAVRAGSAETLVWDGRYRIALPRGEPEWSVGPLGLAGIRLRAIQGNHRSWRTAPALFRDSRLVATLAGIIDPSATGRLQVLDAQCLVAARLGLAERAVPQGREINAG